MEKMVLEEEIVIVGAGIAGLATAIALKRVGIRALVLERSDGLRVSGAALTLAPNAWLALDALGVAHKLTPLYAVREKYDFYSFIFLLYHLFLSSSSSSSFFLSTRKMFIQKQILFRNYKNCCDYYKLMFLFVTRMCITNVATGVVQEVSLIRNNR